MHGLKGRGKGKLVHRRGESGEGDPLAHDDHARHADIPAAVDSAAVSGAAPRAT
jgi:hypothetical protein